MVTVLGVKAQEKGISLDFRIEGLIPAQITSDPTCLRRIVTNFLALATLYSSGWANPVARTIRRETAGFDDLPQGSPARVEFARLHERSRRAMSLAVIVGLLALFLS